MNREQAIEILRDAEVDFEIEDAGFGDGSQVIHNKYVIDSKREAEAIVEAINFLISEAIH